MSYATARVNVPRRGAGRRVIAVAVLFAAVAIGVELLGPLVGGTIKRLGLPLEDTLVIRAQAAEKHLDPALIAAVIYAETKFEPRTSAAGALGLMQIEPATAAFIARKSGGVDFTTGDLATPAINVAYGSWYLRYLLDHYDGAELPAIAAYNAGLGHVDEWLARARAEGATLTPERIPYPETRSYVERVLSAQRAYRETYPRQLGLR